MFLTLIESFFSQIAMSLWARLQGVFATIIEDLPDDEGKILHDAIDQYTKDRAAGKSVGEASADAFTVFYAGERSEAAKIGNLLLQAFIVKAQ